MVRAIAALLALLGISGLATAQGDSPFRIESVLSAFEQMRRTPGFDTAKPLQWGFFFVSSDRVPLQAVRTDLSDDGYRFVSERQDDKGRYWLELAKVEVHTPDTLHKRNNELFAWAKRDKGVIYDGWDVTRSAK
jgi:hypothetical protein